MADTLLSPRDMVKRVQQSSLGDIDTESFPSLLADDAIVEWPYFPGGGSKRLEGAAAVREFLSALPTSGPPVRFESIGDTIVHDTTDPEVVIAEYDVHGVSTASGAALTQRVVLVLRVRGGRIVSMRDYVNPLVLMNAAQK
ncbi:MAG TPA: nuclear transport factor 2 family protein [Stackebrandtia sp.]|uniref:nuclear transport factor 2 family protein n=1 Tax=Stackebrandtia sp. TaxID=2023065 RepID=UPI002D3E597F|nr:nuclear transport factor 2 family protein [Stackebrandtia sp.]HZE38207.1 nuclear transport factor 2 family protein [Stackebrandtia sp.]